MPASPATSSIDVLAKPCSTNARAAAPRIDSRRPASRGTSQVDTDAFTLAAMTTMQLAGTEEELLATHPVAEPLVCGGVRCHGGFDDDGAYVSPRTKNRWPAITAWEEHRTEQFGTPMLDIALSEWPEHYPSVEQTRYLLSEGVTAPLISILTRIGTVEGFGAYLRYSPIPDLQQCFEDDIRGTAMDHLGRGLYEAHARDEAGFEDEGGHKQMWFAARDIAFENPVSEDQTAVMLERMGLAPSPGGGIPASMLPPRLFPDVDGDLEMLIGRMANLLLIEISAFHTFAWAEEWLADTDLVGGEGEASRLVSYIRADETPHVAYLKTTLSEMRDRTFKGDSGRRHAGTDVIGALWERARDASLGERREQNLKVTLGEIEHALDGNPRKGDILERFHQLGPLRPGAAGPWR